MLNKVTKWIAVALAACFLGLLVCLPLAVKDGIQWFQRLTNEEFSPEHLSIREGTKTIRFNTYGKTLAIRQSPTEEAYVEVYDKGTTNPCSVHLSYDGETAQLTVAAELTGFHFNQLERNLAFSLQGIPAVILYIPADMRLEPGDAVWDDYGVQFANREELAAQQEQRLLEEEWNLLEEERAQLEEERSQLEEYRAWLEPGHIPESGLTESIYQW